MKREGKESDEMEGGLENLGITSAKRGFKFFFDLDRVEIHLAPLSYVLEI